MNMKLTLSLFALFIIAPPTFAQAQEMAPPSPSIAPVPSTPPSSSAPPAPAIAPLPSAPLSSAAPVPAVAALFDNDNFLGVHVEEVTRQNMSGYGLTGEPRGVAVTRVVKNSPAERAGLREKDVIVRFDGEEVSSVRKLNRLIDESAPEHSARLTIRRGGAEQELTAKLGRREGFAQTFEGFGVAPLEGELFRRGEEWRAQGEALGHRAEDLRRRAEEMQRQNPGGVYSFSFGGGRRIGVSTSSLGKQLADYFGVQHGALVNSVEENSPAAKAGLKAGDVIVEAEGEQVKDAGDLSRLVNRREEGEVTLTIMRDKQRRAIRLTPERRQPQSFRLTPGVVAPARVAAAPLAARAPRVTVTPPRMNILPPRVLRMRPERIVGERAL